MLYILLSKIFLNFEETFKQNNLDSKDIEELSSYDSGIAVLKYNEKYNIYLQPLKDTGNEVILEKIHVYYKCKDFFNIITAWDLAIA